MTPHLPTRRLLALAAAAFVSQLSSRAQAADLTVLLFDQGQPVAGKRAPAPMAARSCNWARASTS